MTRQITAGLILGLFCLSANAALISRASGAAYSDDVLNITWITDANLAQTSAYDADGLMTFAQTEAWIASLNTAGYLGASDWRLPTSTQPDASCSIQDGWGTYGTGCTGAEMGHLSNVDGIRANQPGPFTNLQPGNYYWTGTDSVCCTSVAFVLAFSNGYQGADSKTTGHYAWAVRSGDIAAVPVPAAAWLIAPAFGLLAPWVRRRQATA